MNSTQHDVRRWAAVLLALLAVVATQVAPALVPHAPLERAAAATPSLKVLVLGDSYSAGLGAGSYDTANDCDRSRKNYGQEYAQLVRERQGRTVSVATRACSGASTTSYFRPQGRLPAQRTWVTPAYDLVALTLGGIDLNFTAVVRQCLATASDNARRCSEVLTRTVRLLRSGAVGERLQRVLADIRTRAGATTTIALVGYPRLEIDTHLTFAGIPLGKKLKVLSDLGEREQRDAVAALNAQDPASPFVFVSTQALFSGTVPWLSKDERGQRHELSKIRVNPARWLIEPAPGGAQTRKDLSYHPTPRGWHRMAELLYRSDLVPAARQVAGEGRPDQ